MIEVINAPWNIGLRPNPDGSQPGTWKAPKTLGDADLAKRLDASIITDLDRPAYDFEPQPGTRIRNALTLREHSLILADAVAASITEHRLPVVVGGDCAVLLGCLVGARRHGPVALLHVDGHCDFALSSGNGLGTAAGRDLALATGRGELLLTSWPGISAELVPDEQVVQLGDRTGDVLPEGVMVVGIDELLAEGIGTSVLRALEHVGAELPIWLHVDLDVLDAVHLPAVDSPGSPGLDYAQLGALLAHVMASGQVVGVDITIYDPDRDPGSVQAPAIVDCLAQALTAEFEGAQP